jgi:4-aminobutyrate aminotransferase-like enzyme
MTDSRRYSWYVKRIYTCQKPYSPTAKCPSNEQTCLTIFLYLLFDQSKQSIHQSMLFNQPHTATGDSLIPDRRRFIAFQQSFHGRSLGALSVTWKPAVREPFGPMLMQDVTFVPFNDLAAVRDAMGPDVCAVIVEPVQGEGGVTPAYPSFLSGLRELCDQHGASLICDEIQIGLGRSGE